MKAVVHRCIVAVVAVAGCSPDPVVGRWAAGDKTFELRDDGSIVAPPRSDPECEREHAAVQACGRKHRWEKDGSRYRITMMTLARPPGAGSLMALHSDGNCRCVVDIEGIAELRGDELVIDGKERVQRLKP